MQVTKRDKELLDWINRFGFVSMRHVAKLWGVGNKIAYRRLRKLIHAGYISHKYYAFNKPGIYQVTRLGVELAQSALTPLKHISAATITHQLMVVSCYLELLPQGGQFITERELAQQRGDIGVGAKPHRPDGIWKIDDKTIAIEVELSTKGTKRLMRILDKYKKSIQYHEVWYLCGNNEVFNKLSGFADKYAFLKVYYLDKWLAQHDR